MKVVISLLLLLIPSYAFGQSSKVVTTQGHSQEFYVDHLNNRVGIGESLPSYRLDVLEDTISFVTNIENDNVLGDGLLLDIAGNTDQSIALRAIRGDSDVIIEAKGNKTVSINPLIPSADYGSLGVFGLLNPATLPIIAAYENDVSGVKVFEITDAASRSWRADIIDDTYAQLRLTNTPLLFFADLRVNSNGVLLFRPSSGYISNPSSSYVNVESFGNLARGLEDNCTAIGYNALASDTVSNLGNSTAVGSGSTANGYLSVAVGSIVTAGSQAVAIGGQTTAGTSSVAIGRGAVATGVTAVAVGREASVTATGGSCVGYSCGAAQFASSLGYNSSALFNNSIALGTEANATKIGEAAIGAASYPINTVSFNSYGQVLPRNVEVNMGGSTGTDVDGADLTVVTGLSTGSGEGGRILFKTSPSSGSGTSVNAAVDRIQIEADGTLSSLNTTYETLVTNDDDIPNKKYVDDRIPVFGTQFQQNSADSVTTTTSSTYQQKVRITTPVIPAGTYRIGWSIELSIDDENSDIQTRVEIDDTTTVAEQDGRVARRNLYYVRSSIAHVALTNASHTIDLDYNNQQGKTLSVRRGKLEIWRVP